MRGGAEAEDGLPFFFLPVSRVDLVLRVVVFSLGMMIASFGWKGVMLVGWRQITGLL